MSPLKLISLNCEGHKHLVQRVIPFLQQEQPDVLNLQEIFAVDIPLLQQATGMQVVQYVPLANVVELSRHTAHAWGAWGICQFSRLPVRDAHHAFYFQTDHQPEVLPLFMKDENPNNLDRAVSMMTVTKDDVDYKIATTHFTWSVKGESTLDQLRDLAALFQLLDAEGELVISGDFNAPRGFETFARLAARYVDNIPLQYTTSLDENWHKAGKLELMVDGLFSSSSYHCDTVRLQAGVSDHMAIVANVSRR